MMRRALLTVAALGAVPIALAALLAPPAQAATALADLAQARVLSEYGAELPATAEVAVTMQDGAPGKAEFIADFAFDRGTGRFLSLFVAEDGTTFRAMGVANVTVPVAVPVRKLMPGDRIAEGDLETLPLRLAEVGGFAVTDAADLFGKEVRRVLRKGLPVMQQSVATPFAVERGDRVTIVLDDGGLLLTAPGRALTDAHLDDLVRVVNLASSKTIDAFVTGEGRVEVMN